jgi:uncharacterized protein (TIGR03437 family)
VFSIVSVLLNDGHGNFGQPVDTKVELPAPFFPTVSVDLNGDGLLDLAGTDGGRFAHLLPGRGNGTFLPAREIGSGIAMIAAAGHFNGDRIADLLVLRMTGGSPPPQLVPPSSALEVLLGNGAGFFRSAGRIEISQPGTNSKVADFDGDGRSDVALLHTSDTETTLAIHLSLPDGIFRAPVRIPVAAGDAILADFNGDGRADVATAAGALIGRGDATFQPVRPWTLTGSPVAAADFTGDELPDIVLGSSGSFSMLAGRGDGSFLSGVEYRTPLPGAVQPADLDGDRRADFVAVSDNAITVLLFRTQDEPSIRRVVSAASGRAAVSPGSLATIYLPAGLSVTGESAALPLPLQLGGVGVEVRDRTGIARLAPLLYVSPSQVNFLVPGTTALGEAAIVLLHEGGRTPIAGMHVDAVAPALFIAFSPGDYPMFSTSLPIPAYIGTRAGTDGRRISFSSADCVPPGQCSLPIRLRSGEDPVSLTLYGTGFRGGNPVNVTCTINGVPVPVERVDTQYTPGVDQIQVTLLPEVRGQPPIGAATLSVSIDGVISNFAGLFLN